MVGMQNEKCQALSINLNSVDILETQQNELVSRTLLYSRSCSYGAYKRSFVLKMKDRKPTIWWKDTSCRVELLLAYKRR